MFKLVRVLENVQHKGAKGWTNEGVKGFKEESNDLQQYIFKRKNYTMQTSSNEIRLFKAYIETISSFNTGQDSFQNIKQAIIQCNVSKVFHSTSPLT